MEPAIVVYRNKKMTFIHIRVSGHRIQNASRLGACHAVGIHAPGLVPRLERSAQME